MPFTKYANATEWLANELSLIRGTPNDIVTVGVYHDTDENVVPPVLGFTTVDLVQPGDSFAEGNKVDVLSLIGPKDGAHLDLAPGVYWRWLLIQSSTEDLIEGPIDTVTIL